MNGIYFVSSNADSPTQLSLAIVVEADLGDEHQTEGERGGEHDEDREQHELSVGVVGEHRGDGHPQHTHDHHVVDTHPHILTSHPWQICHQSYIKLNGFLSYFNFKILMDNRVDGY